MILLWTNQQNVRFVGWNANQRYITWFHKVNQGTRTSTWSTMLEISFGGVLSATRKSTLCSPTRIWRTCTTPRNSCLGTRSSQSMLSGERSIQISMAVPRWQGGGNDNESKLHQELWTYSWGNDWNSQELSNRCKGWHQDWFWLEFKFGHIFWKQDWIPILWQVQSPWIDKFKLTDTPVK